MWELQSCTELLSTFYRKQHKKIVYDSSDSRFSLKITYSVNLPPLQHVSADMSYRIYFENIQWEKNC